MEASLIGACCGAALVTLEMGMIGVTFVARKQVARRYPRLAKHCAVGVKTTSYRCFAGADTFLISWLVTGSTMAATGVVGFELMSKFFLYYGHEMLWSIPFLHRLTSCNRSQS